MSDVKVTIQDKVAVVTLNRPDVRNAMKLSMWHDIASLFKRLGRDANVRAIILTGAGGNFSVGADLSEFAKARSNTAESKDYEVAVDASSDAIASVRQPVIAVLEGYCLGGGCHLSMSCDFRYAHTRTSIGIPAAKLSIVYGVRSTQRLLALVGLTNAKRILYSADRYSAIDAARMGLIDRVCENPMSDAMAFAADVARLAPLSVEGAKKILTELSMGPGALDLKDADAFIDHASASEDYEEGRRAFAEKRPPVFCGK
ncbi:MULTISPECIES: enoyl-CoA hydratase-related protein [unclassified Afipia]|uniref:enoyl-CoA hydratase-related protein n=1 Tax=unclassified Afipia TaxID=2642050 RepID=UPI000465618B|nr:MULTISPECIES: enoyl-CoA hydratase-related protein [unclassified Afipia]